MSSITDAEKQTPTVKEALKEMLFNELYVDKKIFYLEDFVNFMTVTNNTAEKYAKEAKISLASGGPAFPLDDFYNRPLKLSGAEDIESLSEGYAELKEGAKDCLDYWEMMNQYLPCAHYGVSREDKCYVSLSDMDIYTISEKDLKESEDMLEEHRTRYAWYTVRAAVLWVKDEFDAKA